MLLIQLGFFILIKAVCVIHSELFTSTTHLTQLLNTEIALAKNLETFLQQEYRRLDQIQKYINVIKDEIHQAQGNEEYYFGNPINSYLFIKHLTFDWQHTQQILPKNFGKDLSLQWPFPSYDDYTGSAIGLLRLQDTYKISTSHLANGELSTKFKSKPLSALECYELGRVAFTNKDFYHTLLWMDEALDHLNRETNDTLVRKVDILEHIAHATAQQGNMEHALAIAEEMLTIAWIDNFFDELKFEFVLVPNHIRAKNNKFYYETIIKTRGLANQQQQQQKDDSSNLKTISTTNEQRKYEIKNPRPVDSLEGREMYEDLCRQNQSLISPKRQSKLFCRYNHNNHPFLFIQPVKEEQIFDKPIIYLFHDIISHSDIEQIKSLAAPKLQRAVVVNSQTSELEHTNYRVSKSTWLHDNDSPAVARLSRLIEAVTNLTMTTAEELQIANYGIGGHYEPHYDFARKAHKETFVNLQTGNRIATWLTYLSDVEQGGATVFSDAGAYLKPKKGSAAFWYNLHASGEEDYTTRHAACPVLVGNKWVGNKWIHEHGQEFRRPCSLDPMA